MIQVKRLSPLSPVMAFALVALALPGCGGREGKVRGKVTLDSRPLARAQLHFHREGAAENELPVAVMTGEDGQYRVLGFKGETIPTGKYRVTVVRMALKDGTIPEGEKRLEAEARGLLRNHLPRRYEDPSSTPLQAEVHAGGNTVDLELTQ